MVKFGKWTAAAIAASGAGVTGITLPGSTNKRSVTAQNPANVPIAPPLLLNNTMTNGTLGGLNFNGSMAMTSGSHHQQRATAVTVMPTPSSSTNGTSAETEKILRLTQQEFEALCEKHKGDGRKLNPKDSSFASYLCGLVEQERAKEPRPKKPMTEGEKAAWIFLCGYGPFCAVFLLQKYGVLPAAYYAIKITSQWVKAHTVGFARWASLRGKTGETLQQAIAAARSASVSSSSVTGGVHEGSALLADSSSRSSEAGSVRRLPLNGTDAEGRSRSHERRTPPGSRSTSVTSVTSRCSTLLDL